MHRSTVLALALLGVAAPCLADEPTQGPPDFGIDTSGTYRDLNLRDAVLGERVPMGYINTLTHDYIGANDVETATGATARYHPRIAPQFIRTHGYSTLGVGGALYKQVASEPVHAYKFSITDASGATIWYGIADSERPVNFEQLGAIGDDADDDTAAVHAAFGSATAGSQLYPISGLGKTYHVSGNSMLQNGAVLEDAKFVQDAPSTGTRTLTTQCQGAGPDYPSCAGPFTLRRIRIDRGASTTAGTQADAAGIWLANADSAWLEDIEVTGNGRGRGIMLAFIANVRVIRPWVHDMEWTSPTEAGIEGMSGIFCTNCSQVEIIDPRIENLWGTIAWSASSSLSGSQGKAWRTSGGRAYRAQTNGTTGTTAPSCTSGSCSDGGVTWDYMGPAATTKRAYQNDGIGISTSNSVTVRGGLLSHVYDAADIGASNDVWFYGVTYRDADGWAEKWCHHDTNSGSIGSRAIRPGLAGVVTCSVDAGPSYLEHMRIIDSVTTDPGANGNWAGTHAGYWAGDGIDIQFINTAVIDTQAVPTMTQGYRSDATAANDFAAKLINPMSLGHITAARTGFWNGILEGATNGFSVGGSFTSTGSLGTTGFFTMTRDVMTLVNGLNSDIPIARSSYSIAGITGPFSIGGFTAQPDGTFLRVASQINQPMTIVNEDGSSSGVNRIRTNTNANVVLPAITSYAEFMYSNLANRWLLLSTSPPPISTGTSGHAIPYLDTANTWSAQQLMSVSAAGAATVPLAVRNAGGGANAEVVIDLSPTSNAPGARSAQIASVSTGGASDANLVFRTANGNLPAERMSINKDGLVSVILGVKLTPVAVVNLSTCDAAAEGTFRTVTNATATTFNSVVAGGGTNHMPVYCNGTAWVLH